MKTRVIRTNDVYLTTVRPVGTNSPVCRPDTAAMGHGVEVSDEQTAIVLLVGGDADTGHETG